MQSVDRPHGFKAWVEVSRFYDARDNAHLSAFEKLRNIKPATNQRPCSNWPRPGIKKLARAAITFPLDPLPIFDLQKYLTVIKMQFPCQIYLLPSIFSLIQVIVCLVV